MYFKELFYYKWYSCAIGKQTKMFPKISTLGIFYWPSWYFSWKEHVLCFSHHPLTCWMRETQNRTLSLFFILTYNLTKVVSYSFFLKLLTQMKSFFFFNVKLPKIHGKYLCEIFVWFWCGSILILFKPYIWYFMLTLMLTLGSLFCIITNLKKQ